MNEDEASSARSGHESFDAMASSFDRSAAIESVNQMFRDRARRAFAELGVDPIEYMRAHPQLDTLQLAKAVHRGSNAIGIALLLLRLARERGCVRDVAKELLVREIRTDFPAGWKSSGPVHPIVRLSWDDDIRLAFGKNDQDSRSAIEVIRNLTIDSPPPEGWLPSADGDPFVDELFDRFWPTS